MSTSAAGEPLARGRGLTFSYARGEAALHGVDVELPSGTVTVIAGANGAGKTTLLRILAGNLEPTSGEVVVLGLPRPARARGAARRRLREQSTYVPQEIALDPEMTGRECLDLMATLYGPVGNERRRRIEEVAERCAVTPYLDRRVQALSGGLRRRFHLAAGLLHEPRLLLLDEPGVGLDADAGAALWADLLRRAHDGAAVAVVTHELEAAERHADAVLILERGELVGSRGGDRR
ncbi:MAG TPA: ABC transporter ATP-binding protein [Thermoanaerobaculia bacterium]|nr:ABC transporter ATP-binding protein [Thermoanaerobaculia bacterium]